MNHPNMYAVGLALCTFANIASEEMSRDLANEIEKLLGSSNTYIRKKVRIILLMVYVWLMRSAGGSLCATYS
jgi:AP-1 complex subunit gamma-1